MSESKNDNLVPFYYNSTIETHPLNQYQEFKDIVAPFLAKKDVASVMCTMKSNYFFYRSILEKRNMVEKALTYVVRGDLNSLLILIKENLIQFPSLVFEKYVKITAPRGQTYYNVSSYQLMTFLCDADMKKQTMSLISSRFNVIRKAQYAEIDCGGADIIKLDRNPMDIIKNEGFGGLIESKTTVTLFDGSPQEVILPLLENPDGIICYQDENYKKRLFYANKENQTILPFKDCIITEETKPAFEQFKKSFDTMENNSGRRSSDKEHQLITKILNISLTRKGVIYKDNSILYRDNRTPFNLVNVYRKYIRLYEEAYINASWGTVQKSWCKGVGKSQGEEIWLLQRICEENKPFYPLKSISFDDFTRECTIIGLTNKNESVFDDGFINISDFAIYKGDGRSHAATATARGAWTDLVAICWLIKDAKANVIEFKPEQDVQMSCTIR